MYENNMKTFGNDDHLSWSSFFLFKGRQITYNCHVISFMNIKFSTISYSYWWNIWTTILPKQVYNEQSCSKSIINKFLVFMNSLNALIPQKEGNYCIDIVHFVQGYKATRSLYARTGKSLKRKYTTHRNNKV